MTNYEFEKIVKQAVIQIFGGKINIDQLDFMWFTHELDCKKCVIWGQPMGDRYIEVIYNRNKNKIYADIYNRIFNYGR